jgi:hypothetical protein
MSELSDSYRKFYLMLSEDIIELLSPYMKPLAMTRGTPEK